MAIGSGGGGDAESAYGTAKTSVWWDIENCHVPRGSDAHVIAQNISSALADVGYKGAVTISAYGDTNKIPTAVQHALSSTGIALNHVPAGVKDASDKKILVDMLFWAVDNPPPANYLLISGDRDFSNALHQLRMRRYNILLAHAPNVSQALVAAARRVWLWTSLLSGGPPRQDPTESFDGNKSCSETGKKCIGDPIPLNGSSSMRNEDNSLNENSDYNFRGKQVWRNQAPSAGGISRTSSLPEIKEGRDLKFQKQTSLPVTSSSDPHASTQVQPNHAPSSSSYTSSSNLSGQSEAKQFNKAPHEFFGANKPRASVGSSNQPPYPGGAINNGNISNYQQSQYAQSLRPSNEPPPRASYSNSYNYSSYPPPHQQRPRPFRPDTPPDLNRLKISDHPSNAYQNSPFTAQHSGPPSFVYNRPPSHLERPHGPQLNVLNSNMPYNGKGENPGCQIPPGIVQGLIGNIQGALCELKANKMIPTEANIADCIRYRTRNHNFNVQMALNCALEHNVVVMHKLGANLPFYIGKNDILWRCVNPLDTNITHLEAALDAVQNYLSSARGQAAISSSECRFHAATILKTECLPHLALGDMLQILNYIVQVKKWIVPSSFSWQPVSFTL